MARVAGSVYAAAPADWEAAMAVPTGTRTGGRREGDQGEPTLREFLEERIHELTRRIDTLTVSIDNLNRSSEQFLTRSAYEVAHEALRAEHNQTRNTLADVRAAQAQGDSDLRGQIATMRARFAGAAAALSLGIAIVIALLTILEIGGH